MSIPAAPRVGSFQASNLTAMMNAEGGEVCVWDPVLQVVMFGRVKSLHRNPLYPGTLEAEFQRPVPSYRRVEGRWRLQDAAVRHVEGTGFHVFFNKGEQWYQDLEASLRKQLSSSGRGAGPVVATGLRDQPIASW